MLPPPRLPALWVGFNASAQARRRHADSGGIQTQQGEENAYNLLHEHAEVHASYKTLSELANARL